MILLRIKYEPVWYIRFKHCPVCLFDFPLQQESIVNAVVMVIHG